MTIHEQALARILLLQNMITQLEEQESMFSFVCRGLEEIPGVEKATYHAEPTTSNANPDAGCFPLHLNRSHYGEICLSLTDHDAFQPYHSYISNLCFMIAVILEERRQSKLNQQHQQNLEIQIDKRTKQLKEEILERRMAEERAVKAKKRAELYLDISEAMIVELDQQGKIRVLNKRGCEILGYRPGEAIGQDWFRICVPALGQPVVKRIFSLAMQGQGEFAEYFENEIVTREGELRYISWHNVLQHDDAGRVIGVLSSGIDITDRKRAEEDRLKLESQLFQAQKIESIGQLAGGVAHDFNNMLGVILGHAELALMKADPDIPFIEDLQEIRTAAKRSADLTRQLLTFARKQTISPQILDLNETVAGMLKMLQRLLGENIQLSWEPAPCATPVLMDPSQIDQILANLCVNARDAIDGIGKIAIETENCSFAEADLILHPEAMYGDYVRLAVSDDGPGIDQQVLPQIFEPFFTTKKFGQGTGLGLATVFGAVKQNNGFIEVVAEPGKGATFQIYLPRQQSTLGTVPEAATPLLRRGDETILLVEDDQMLLKLVKAMLEESGYQVLAASTINLAISTAKEYPGPIHLLISDMIMPEMNGRDLRDVLQVIRPQMKVIFMSGYTADIITREGVIDAGVHFLQKPISLEALTTKVRAVLNL